MAKRKNPKSTGSRSWPHRRKNAAQRARIRGGFQAMFSMRTWY